MYIIELIVKILMHRKEKPTYNPLLEDGNSEIMEYESCEHVFMPIDSTNETLACSKCGFLVKRRELKNKNFFMRKEL